MKKCIICESEYDTKSSCKVCGYNPMSARDEKLIHSVNLQGEGATTAGRQRKLILTSDRLAILRAGKIYKEFRLNEIDSVKISLKRHYEILGLLILVALGFFIKNPMEAKDILSRLAFTISGFLVFFAVWFFWKEPVFIIKSKEDETFQERFLRQSKQQVGSFTEIVTKTVKG